MLLIPQLYLRNNKVVSVEGMNTPLYDADPIVMCRSLKDAGAEAVYLVDLNISTIGDGPNLPLIQKIKQEVGLQLFLGDNFRSVQAIDPYAKLDPKLIVLETVAYQEPDLVKQACQRYSGKIAVKIFVRAGKITIPGWAVSPTKTAIDYAQQFGNMGVKSFFYSDISEKGVLEQKNLDNILFFCKKVYSNVICTSEIRNAGDIEKLMTVGAPGLNGLVLAHAFYENRIDLKAAINLVLDLSVSSSNEPTLTED
ncbi:MAG: HisA/HisF-related TIM barrel protein [Pseudomonadota bacterium]